MLFHSLTKTPSALGFNPSLDNHAVMNVPNIIVRDRDKLRLPRENAILTSSCGLGIRWVGCPVG